MLINLTFKLLDSIHEVSSNLHPGFSACPVVHSRHFATWNLKNFLRVLFSYPRNAESVSPYFFSLVSNKVLLVFFQLLKWELVANFRILEWSDITEHLQHFFNSRGPCIDVLVSMHHWVYRISVGTTQPHVNISDHFKSKLSSWVNLELSEIRLQSLCLLKTLKLQIDLFFRLPCFLSIILEFFKNILREVPLLGLNGVQSFNRPFKQCNYLIHNLILLELLQYFSDYFPVWLLNREHKLCVKVAFGNRCG